MRRIAVSWLAGALVLAGIALAHPAVAAGWLGVYSQQITPELRDGIDYNGAGALVSRVVPDSPADKAGIQRGDVIIRLGTRDVASPEDLINDVRSSPLDRPIDVLVIRDGKKQLKSVQLTERPEAEGPGDANDDDSPAPMPRMHDTPPPSSMDRDDSDHDRDFVFHMPDMSQFGGRGRLGVRVESLSPELASYFGARGTKGALVLEVTKGSAAEAAGLQAGDVVTRVDGKTIDDADDLIEAVRSSEGTVSISLLRHGSTQTVEAKLERMPRTMRFQGQGWRRSPDGQTWQWSSPDSDRRRVIIDDGHAPKTPNSDLSDKDREELNALRDELRQLKEELRKMREDEGKPQSPDNDDNR